MRVTGVPRVDAILKMNRARCRRRFFAAYPELRGQKIVRREAGAKGQTIDGAAMLARVAELAGQTGGDRAAQEARLGEMLECLCAAAEAYGLDAETALRGQTKKRVERLRAEDEKTL